jgi:hypothetical protein
VALLHSGTGCNGWLPCLQSQAPELIATPSLAAAPEPALLEDPEEQARAGNARKTTVPRARSGETNRISQC